MGTVTRGLFALTLATACGASEGPAPTPIPAAPAPRAETPAPPPVAPFQPPQWGEWEHVAGRGETSEEGVNAWKPAFEGKSATAAELSRPYFAVADAAGQIYIADKEAHAVRRVAPDGTIHTHAGSNAPGDDGDEPRAATRSRLHHPNGLALAADGTLFVLDLDNGKIRRVAKDGTMTTAVTTGAPIDTGRGLWASPEGDSLMWAEKTRLRRWRLRGRIDEAATGFVSLGNLAWDPTSSTFLVCDRGGDRVMRVLRTGALEPFAGSATPGASGTQGRATEVFLDGPRSVAVLPEGGVLIATHESAQLWIVAPEGQATLLLGRADGFTPPIDLGGAAPTAIRGMSLTPEGDLLFVHGDAGLVHRLHRKRTDAPAP
jgi:sugar lactone lactonase YvrE